jgi:hypothetical protein
MKKIFLAIALLTALRVTAEIIPDSRRIVWKDRVGVAGGIPLSREVHQTLSAGASQATIQAALNSCPNDKAIMLPAGTYSIANITIPTGRTLRGAGQGVTILDTTGPGDDDAAVFVGQKHAGEFQSGVEETAIVSGYTKGSTSIVVNNATGIALGDSMTIDQLNDSAFPVRLYGTYGTIDYGTRDLAARAMGQTVEVTGVSGTTITFSPPLYHTYSSGLSPEAVHWTPNGKNAGLENLTVKANNHGYQAMIGMYGVQNCWVYNVETDYADGDHYRIWSAVKCEVNKVYMHDAYSHTSGQTDGCLMFGVKSSGCLVINSIFYRMHIGLMMNWGSSGNAVAYNYFAGHFDSSAVNVQFYEMNDNHGAHPMMNLWEGNIGGQFRADSAWGSSSHGYLIRNWFQGYGQIFPPYTGRSAWDSNNWHYATQGLRALTLDFQQHNYNVLGNIIGSPVAVVTNNDVRQVISPTERDYETTVYLISLGYSDVSDGGEDPDGDTLPATTSIFHGNFDTTLSTSDGVVWDAGIADHDIPDSELFDSKPSFMGTLDWPGDPLTAKAKWQAGQTNLFQNAAKFRFENGFSDPPAEGGGSPTSMSGSISGRLNINGNLIIRSE